MIGKLQQVALRDVWQKEATDFTTWLCENIDILNEQVGVELSIIEREKSVGSFSADVFAEDSEGRLVIIENQLEKSDHDHLGKVLTYLSNLDAKIAIWICSDPRQEHIKAIDYLNEMIPDDTTFYLIKVQAIRIEDSPPAPMFSIVAGPTPELRSGGKIKKELAANDLERKEFFEQLLAKSNSRISLFNSVSAVGYQNWISTGSGKYGLMWAYVVRSNDARVELTMQSPDAEINERRYHFLYSQRDKIEKAFKETIYWDFKEGRKQHYLKVPRHNGGLKNNENWNRIQTDLVEVMERFSEVLAPYIQKMS